MFENERLKKINLIKEKCNDEEKARKMGSQFNRKLRDEKYLMDLMDRMLSKKGNDSLDFLSLVKDKYIISADSELLDYISLFDVKTGRKIVFSTMIKDKKNSEDLSNGIYFFYTKQAAFETGSLVWTDKFDVCPFELDAVYYFKNLDDGKDYSIAGRSECEDFVRTHNTLILADNKGKSNQYFKIFQRLYFKFLVSNNLNTEESYKLLSDIINTSNSARQRKKMVSK